MVKGLCKIHDYYICLLVSQLIAPSRLLVRSEQFAPTGFHKTYDFGRHADSQRIVSILHYVVVDVAR